MKILPSVYYCNTVLIPVPPENRDHYTGAFEREHLANVAHRLDWFDLADLKLFTLTDIILGANHECFLDEKYSDLLTAEYEGYEDARLPIFETDLGCAGGYFSFTQKEHCDMFCMSPEKYLHTILDNCSRKPSLDEVLKAFCVREQLLTPEQVGVLFTQATLLAR